jgi:hypothetical protein
MVITPVNSGYDYGYDVALQLDNRIVVVGDNINQFVVVRYSGDPVIMTYRPLVLR